MHVLTDEMDCTGKNNSVDISDSLSICEVADKLQYSNPILLEHNGGTGRKGHYSAFAHPGASSTGPGAPPDWLRRINEEVLVCMHRKQHGANAAYTCMCCM